MSGSGTRRTEDFHTLRTRQLILQNQDGTYPTSGGLLYFNSANGTVGDSGINVDTGGNVVILENITVLGTSIFDKLEVTGLSALNNINVTGSLSVQEQTYLKNVDVSGALQVIGPTILTSVQAGNVEVTGPTTLSSLQAGNVEITGPTSLNSLQAGNVDVSGYLKIPVNPATSGVIQKLTDSNGSTTTSNSILVQGTGNVTCSVNANTLTVYGAGGGGGGGGNTDISGTLQVYGTTTLTAPISGETSIALVVNGPTEFTGNIVLNGAIIDLYISSSLRLPSTIYGTGMSIYGYITWATTNITFPITASTTDVSYLGIINPQPTVQYITVAPFTKITFNGVQGSAGTIYCDNSLSDRPSVFLNGGSLVSITSWYVYRYNGTGIQLEFPYYTKATPSIQNVAVYP